MTERDEMVESIHDAMEAVEKAHAASQLLKQNANAEAVKIFHDRMIALAEHLVRLQTVLDNNEVYTMDEIAEAIGHSMGTTHTYHRMESMETK